MWSQDYQVVVDKQLTQYLLFSQVKLEDAPRLLKIPKTEWPDVWIRLPRHKWPKSWAIIEDPVILLERNLYGHPLAGIVMGQTIRGSFVRTWMRGNTKLGMHVRSSKTRVISVSVCGRHQNCWKEEEYGSHVEELDEKCRHWRTHIISWPWRFGMYSAWMQTTCNNYWTLFEDVWIICWCNRDMEGHAQKCVERYCELANKKVEQLYKDWSSNRRNSNQLENCLKFAHKLSWIACIWDELDDLTFCGQSTSMRDQSQNGHTHVTDVCKADFLHSSHKRFPTILSYGKHGTAL